MKILSIKNESVSSVLQILQRSRVEGLSNVNVVKRILARVQKDGDDALYYYARKFDGLELGDLSVSKEEIACAYKLIDKDLLEAIKFAKANIVKFHKTTLPTKQKSVETVPGVKVWREFRPIEKVGLYVPGGKAAYPSTVLMLAVPAKLAGCAQVVMCTPARRDGTCDPAVLVAADLCGVDKIFKIGGAQAVAAMAYGTSIIPKVYKIVGPGNSYVQAAKMMLYGEVDIDMPAGPSELMMIADESANPAFVAADFLSQLEHGEDSQAVLLTTSLQFAAMVQKQVLQQAKKLSRRTIINQSLKNSLIIVCENMAECIFIANEYAPEHLEIIVSRGGFSTSQILKKIINVGSVFLGPYAAEPLGDYVTGANHTLPTSGYAKMFAPLSCESFGKMIQVQKVSLKGFKKLGNSVRILANAEGLDAHAETISVRYRELQLNN